MKHTNFLRKCNTCGLEAHTKEDLELFTYKEKNKHNRINKCKNCKNKYDRDRRRNKPESYYLTNKKYRLKKIYNVSVEDYNKKMSTSDCCEICGTKENLCYDHCHDTMKFRGVLCKSCNKGLGIFEDNLEGINKALEYLRRANER